MVDSIFRLANLSLSTRAAEAESAGFTIPPGFIGYVVLGLIAIPVIVLVSSAIFGAPRNMKVPGLFVVCLGVLISATIVGFALIGSLLGFVLPK
jgi:hypothetical protein